MKRYGQLTNEEKVVLDNQGFADAVKLEAIERGIEPAVTLSEKLRSSGWRGYYAPANGVRVWVLDTGNSYGTRLGYLDPELARRALEGAVVIGDVYRGGKSFPGIRVEEVPSVKEMVLTNGGPGTDKGFSLSDTPDSNEAFDKLVEECKEDWHKVCQDAYDAKVRAEQWTEYLRLASGSVEIAGSFWRKAGKGEPPVVV